MRIAVFAAAAFVGCASRAATTGPDTCEKLSALKLPSATVTAAQLVPAGAFVPPHSSTAASFRRAPAFCRVALQLNPSADSDIKVEVWMPAANWNGKYQGQANGGFAGAIDYQALAGAVTNDYATAGTDTGHSAEVTDAKWALGHPEKVTDFGWRAIHEMTVAAKAVIREFYGAAPNRSYFAGCSNGGRQALIEAQRFPVDYDGIIAGAPANYWTHLLTKGAVDVQALQADPASYIPASKIPAISAAVLAACDAQDGVADGILNNPTQCHFDPKTMLCQGKDFDQCLTAPQITALKTIYSPLRNSRGEPIFPGYEPGGEEGPGGWGLWITGQRPDTSLIYAFASGYFSDMVSTDGTWDYHKFAVDPALAAGMEKTGRALNAIDPDLSRFRNRGGKLILWHGWNDAAIPPLNTVDYYNSVDAAMGRGKADSFVRLYMAPGVQHCAGGPGPDSFQQFGPRFPPGDPQHDMSVALEQWVEKGTAPAAIIATKYAKTFDPASGVKMTRPLCPYPMVARYKGTGDTNDAANFLCAAAK